MILGRHKWESTKASTLTEFGETQVSKTKVKVSIGMENDSECSVVGNISSITLNLNHTVIIHLSMVASKGKEARAKESPTSFRNL